MSKHYNKIEILNNQIDSYNKKEEIVYTAFDYMYIKLRIVPKAYRIRREVKRLEGHFFKQTELIKNLNDAALIIDRLGVDSFLDHWKENRGIYLFTTVKRKNIIYEIYHVNKAI